MTGSVASSAGRIFISYRRGDSDYAAGFLYYLLGEQLGPERVFRDVDSIQFGNDFAEEITDMVGSCTALLAVIGRGWLRAAHEDGRRRLDHPGDWVRLEIATGLLRGIRVIPVLVDDARMPRPEDLPAILAGLAHRQAFKLSADRFDISGLLKLLDPSHTRTDRGLTGKPLRREYDTSSQTWTQTRAEMIQRQFRYLMFYGGASASRLDLLIEAVQHKVVQAVCVYGHDDSGERILEVELRVDWMRSALLEMSIPRIAAGLSGWDELQAPEIRVAGRRFASAATELRLSTGSWVELTREAKENPVLNDEWTRKLDIREGRPKWKSSPMEVSEIFLDLGEATIYLRRAGG